MPIQSITFAAPIIRAALATLAAQMPAHVAAFNAEADNSIDLDVPAGYVFGATDVMDAFPIVEVSILEGTLGPFSVGTAGVGDADHTPRLQVILWLQGVTGEVPGLYEQALGYARCIIEILCADGALGANAEVSGTRDDAIDYGVHGPIPVNPDEPDRAFRKWKIPTIVRFAIEAVEAWQ